LTQHRSHSRSTAIGFVCVVGLSLCLAPGALAHAQTAAARQEARERFDRGLRLFNQDNNDGALAEFTRAYELVPHPQVLLNIGLVHAAMHHPLEAVAAFDAVLANPAAHNTPEARAAAAHRSEQAALIGEVMVSVDQAGARIEVDNLAAGTSPLSAPLRVSSGEHIVGVIAPGKYPERQRVVVAGQARVEVKFVLRPLETSFAHVALKSNTAGADVLIDGAVVGRTPLPASLALAPGSHTIEMRRAGYVSAQRTVDLGEGATGEVQLDLSVDGALLSTQGGRLALEIRETNALVFVDGMPQGGYERALPLPPGPHQLRVERAGFLPFQRSVDVPAGETLAVSVQLEPTAEERARYHDAASTQRTWAVVSLITGGVLVGGGTAFLIVNQGKKNDAEATYNNSDLKTPEGMCHPGVGGSAPVSNDACIEELRLNLAALEDARSRDVYGWIGVGVGAAALGVGLVLLLTGDDPGRYDHSASSDVFALHNARPLAWADAHGGGLGMSGRF
jgi:hypothetical protein